jgi:hypothetical protein
MAPFLTEHEELQKCSDTDAVDDESVDFTISQLDTSKRAVLEEGTVQLAHLEGAALKVGVVK